MSSTTVHVPLSEEEEHKEEHWLKELTMNLLRECVTGGVAACGATIFSNPLEVVKTRMQLQGELQSRGTYAVHYRNVFHAFYNIAQGDGKDPKGHTENEVTAGRFKKPEDCVSACLKMAKKDAKFNGVTIRSDNVCRCKRTVVAVNGSSRFKTCVFAPRVADEEFSPELDEEEQIPETIEDEEEEELPETVEDEEEEFPEEE